MSQLRLNPLTVLKGYQQLVDEQLLDRPQDALVIVDHCNQGAGGRITHRITRGWSRTVTAILTPRTAAVTNGKT